MLLPSRLTGKALCALRSQEWKNDLCTRTGKLVGRAYSATAQTAARSGLFGRHRRLFFQEPQVWWSAPEPGVPDEREACPAAADTAAEPVAAPEPDIHAPRPIRPPLRCRKSLYLGTLSNQRSAHAGLASCLFNSRLQDHGHGKPSRVREPTTYGFLRQFKETATLCTSGKHAQLDPVPIGIGDYSSEEEAQAAASSRPGL